MFRTIFSTDNRVEVSTAGKCGKVPKNIGVNKRNICNVFLEIFDIYQCRPGIGPVRELVICLDLLTGSTTGFFANGKNINS